MSSDLPEGNRDADRAAALEFIGREPGAVRDTRATGFRGREAIEAVKAAIATATRQLGEQAPEAWDYTSSVFIGVIAEVMQFHPDAVLHSVESLNPFGRGPYFTHGQLGLVARVMLPYVDGGEVVVDVDLTGSADEVSLGTNAWVGYFLTKKPAFAGVLRATDEREIQRMVPLRQYLHAYAEDLMDDPYHSGHIAWE
jgi:hypothetical protein